jgi:pimeloyl-ACP methyl ester carboxylesterase
VATRPLVAITAAVVTMLALAAPAAAGGGFGTKCGESPFECTRVKVPIDRSGTVPGKLSLYLERSPGGGSDPIFALAGGPGQGNSTQTLSFNRGLAAALTHGRYLVVFDQRGTGKSGALNCPELERETGRPLDVRAEACAARLGPRRAYYTTRDSVEDLEAVRKRIGRDRITIYGVSYGTKVAVAYALRYPQHVKRLVLDSVVEPEGQNAFELDTFAALPRVLREVCRGECARVTPDLAGDVAELASRLRVAPLRGPFVDRRGRRRIAQITERALYEQLKTGDLIPDARAEYPGAIHAALKGDPAPLLRIEHRLDGLGDEPVPPDAVQSLSFTLMTATVCEEAPLPWDRTVAPAVRLQQARDAAAALPDASFAPFDRGIALALDSNSLLFQCSRWPAAPDAPVLGSGPLPDVPVLVLEGMEDMRTPLEVGTRLADRFAHATVVAVPKTGHAVVGQRGAGCVATVLRRFFANRSIGTPCRRARRSVRIRALLPTALGSIAPAKGTPGKPGRTLAGTLLTLHDFYREYYTAALLLPTARGGGLRGGRFDTRGNGLRLFRYSLVPGLTVSGRLTNASKPTGTLKVAGAAASAGTLKLARNGTLSGRLGGRAVRARFTAPSPFF